MSEVSEFGWFWLPSDESRRFPGTLKYSSENGGELSLYPEPDVDENLVEHGATRLRIVGILGSDHVTLDRCFPVHTQIFGGEQRLSVGVVVRGACFDDDGPLEFTSISFEVDGAPEWIGKTAVARDWRHENGESMRYQLTLDPIPPESVDASFGSLSLAYGWSTEGGDAPDEDTIRQTRRFKLRFDELQPVGELLRWARAVQDLVTIASNSESHMDTLVVEHPGVMTEGARGSYPKRLELLITSRSGPRPPAKRRRPRDLLFTYEDAGGLEGLARWLVVRDELRHAVDSLLSLRSGRVMYLENRLQNVVGAAETLHRLRFPNEVLPQEDYRTFKRSLVKCVPKEHREWLHSQLQYSNEPRLAARLHDLVALGGEPALALVGESDAWSAEIRDVRNAFVHEPSRNAPVSSERVHYLCESVYFVLVLCLMRDCGFDTEVLDRIGEHQEVKWVRERLEATAIQAPGT